MLTVRTIRGRITLEALWYILQYNTMIQRSYQATVHMQAHIITKNKIKIKNKQSTKESNMGKIRLGGILKRARWIKDL